MLKKKINSLDEVDKKYKDLYVKQLDGTFLLDVFVEGAADEKASLDGLKKNNHELKGEKLKLQELLKVFEDKENERTNKDLLENKKYDELLLAKDKEWQTKYEKLQKENVVLTENIKKTFLDNKVSSLATELAGDRAELLKPHLKTRLSVIEKDGSFVLEIKDINGNVSPMTLEQLGVEFKGNELFAPILSGRKASGSGGGGDEGNNRQHADASTHEKYYNPQTKDYNAARQNELQTKNKELHDSLVKKYDLTNPSAHVF